ncbi:hypothetical protein [Agarilytica rhodophyticola]|uniref:hypothetical protein n=1 Tax=Agarilytica rhodophyticola TaxID=1737490 RepID=UPI000B342C9A|nr:hypothetical protein [Agarilytica rhodophyticola]
MQWLQEKSKKFVKSFFLTAYLIVGLCLRPVYAVDEKRLWLPTKYNVLFLDLKEAARVVEALEHCKTVLRGTIDIDQSREDHPIYRILCRKHDGRSYNEMVDGLTFKPLTSHKEINVEEIEARKLHLWSLCEEAVKSKVKLIKDMEWVTELPVKPKVYEEAKVHFVANFDAKDGYGAPLRYRAFCSFGPEDALSVRISPRKSD